MYCTWLFCPCPYLSWSYMGETKLLHFYVLQIFNMLAKCLLKIFLNDHINKVEDKNKLTISKFNWKSWLIEELMLMIIKDQLKLGWLYVNFLLVVFKILYFGQLSFRVKNLLWLKNTTQTLYHLVLVFRFLSFQHWAFGVFYDIYKMNSIKVNPAE